MRADEVLDKAADKYESGEWTWFQYGKDLARTYGADFCISEAVWKVNLSEGTNDDWFSRHVTVRRALRTVLDEKPITKWNDTEAQNKEEVIDALRRAAQLVRDSEDA